MAIDENGVVTFTDVEQEAVNKIVQDRVARVKAEKPSDYDDLKGIVDELDAFGYKGTVAEKKALIKSQREALESQRELDELTKEAEDEGMSPTYAKKIKKLETIIEGYESERQAKKADEENLTKAEKAKKDASDAWDKQVEEFNESHDDVDLKELAENPKFMKFIKGKGLPLKELYEDFVEFIGETEAETIAKVKSKESRSTSSGKGESSHAGMSNEDKKTLEQWNNAYPHLAMSQKEWLSRQ